MKVVNYKEILPTAMDNDMVKHVAGRVLIGKEDGADNFCMRIFEMKQNGYTPKHTHAWEHEIFVHTGNGEAFIDGTWYPVSAGSAIFVPPNVEHQFRNTQPELFTFVCLIPEGAPEL